MSPSGYSFVDAVYFPDVTMVARSMSSPSSTSFREYVLRLTLAYLPTRGVVTVTPAFAVPQWLGTTSM